MESKRNPVRINADEFMYGFNDTDAGNAMLNPFNNPPPPTALNKNKVNLGT